MPETDRKAKIQAEMDRIKAQKRKEEAVAQSSENLPESEPGVRASEPEPTCRLTKIIEAIN